VAPGVGIESITDPGSTLFATKPAARLWGTVATATEPYLALTGTSMASPVVSGTIALMLEANPSLTPNLVKAILQYTAETKRRYDGLTQGAGFLNARGAVELARALAAGNTISHSHLNDPATWNGRIVWGNRRLARGLLSATANAWRSDVIWGSAETPDGQEITWGVTCDQTDCDSAVNSTYSGENIVWGTLAASENIVWGTACGGSDCENIVWGTFNERGGENIVWGTSGDENIVWGTTVVGDVEDVVWPARPMRRRWANGRTAVPR
jgi:hypothetical protein